MNSARDEKGRERTCRGRGRASERESERARERASEREREGEWPRSKRIRN